MSTTLDDAWFDRFHTIKDQIGEAYELLLPTLETLDSSRKDFESSDYKKNLSLYPNRADVDKLSRAREQLHALKEAISRDESDSRVRSAYLDSISVADWNAAMIIAGTNADDAGFKRANDTLYDQPNADVFKAVCHWIRKDAQETIDSGDPQLAELAANVLSKMPDLYGDHRMIVPSEKVFHSVRELHFRKNGYYDQLFGVDGLPNEPYIEQHVGNKICQQALRNIGSDYTMAMSDDNIWAVFPSRKQVVSPRGYRLARDEFIGIVCHEIGSHVLESVNGLQSPLKLLSSGLAGFEKGNEGRAFLREQIIYENEHIFLQQFAWEYIALLHLSVSLAAGLHKEKYDLVKLYDVLYALYIFWRTRRYPLATNNELFARDEAWQLCVRVLKGTSGQGGAYMKDTVYLEGNIRCWQLAADDPSIILFGDTGKFDVTNPDHVELVRSLHV